MSKVNGGPAFPCGLLRFDASSASKSKDEPLYQGLTKKDVFMLILMQASICANNWTVSEQDTTEELASEVRAHSILADAMLKESGA